MLFWESPYGGDSNEHTQHTIILQEIEKATKNWVLLYFYLAFAAVDKYMQTYYRCTYNYAVKII